MGLPSKAFPIDPIGRVLITEAADTKVRTQQITVTATAVELKITTNPLKRRKLLITVPPPINPVPPVIYIDGDSSVSHTTGYPMYLLDQLELDVDDGTEVWAITESGETEIHIMEVE